MGGEYYYGVQPYRHRSSELAPLQPRARRAGIYTIVCKVAKHLPMMSGQLVVLPGLIASAVG